VLEEQPPLDLASALTLLGDVVTARVLDALAGTGLRPGHGYVVQRLLVAPATATEMAEELGVSQQAVSKSVQELVALGMALPVADEGDRRRRPVRLTAAGRGAVRRARTARRAVDEQAREALGAEGFEETLANLTVVLDALGLGDRVRRRAVPPPAGDRGV